MWLGIEAMKLAFFSTFLNQINASVAAVAFRCRPTGITLTSAAASFPNRLDNPTSLRLLRDVNNDSLARGNSMARLANKYALITGASSGIGRAAAKRFAAEGVAVACLDPS
jgi:NADPH:quinone reductase-like Zn-dependent oxidoreductase